jgi:hypothetical protein
MAARFWVGGTGNWSDTARWSATSGGAGGQSVPGSADTAAFTAASGGGTATVDSNVTIQTLTMTGYTGTLAFGTNTISLNGTAGTVFTGATTHSVSGTPVINVTQTGGSAITVIPGAVTEANSISFNFTGGTYTLTFLATASNAARNVNFTGYAGSLVAFSTCFIYGNLTLSTGMSLSSGTSALTFGATSGTQIITSNTKAFDCPIIFNGIGGTFQLFDNMTTGASRTTTLTNGTLNLSGKTLTTGLFASNNSNTRTIAFGIGNIICNAAGGTLWTTATVTGLTVTGTPVVNISNSGAVATTVATGTLNEANAISFNFTIGTYSLSFLNTASYTAKNVNFTGFAGTWAATSTGIVYGNFTLSTGMTLTASASTLRFGATSGTQIITTNAKTIDFTLAVNGVGGTVKLADALTMGATRTFNITNGTFDGDNKTISGAASINPSLSTTGTYTIKNVSTALTFYTGQSSVVTLGSDCTFGAFNQINNSTSLDLASFQLTCASFISPAGTSRTLAFGTGNITITGSGTVFQNAATITGTPVVNVTYAGATAVTVQPGALAEATAISFNFSAGTYPLTLFANLGESVKNLNFTGYAGAWNRSSTCIIYGNLTLSAGMTTPASSGLVNFRATSGVQIITSNAVTYDGAFGIDGVGGTVRLADALLMGTTRTLTHTNGTLDLNGKTLTVGTAYTTATGTKDLTFNGGTLVCPTAAATAFNNAVPTGFTTTAGTGTGKISMTAATAKTFVGGGSTYNCTLSNDGAGALTISGSNTFTTIANGVSTTQFTFTSGTTTTVTNWNVTTISGGLITIISSTAGSAATLSKASGTVLSSYVSIKDSTATGGATWYATSSTNVSGNTGWIFGVDKYWVGGTGNWSNAARWATSSGGAGGSGINIADSAVFNSSSGGGTATVDSNISIQNLTMTGYTGTLAFGTNTISLTSVGPTNIPYIGDSTYSVTGTPIINVTTAITSGTVTVTPGIATEANSISFNFTGGTYLLTFLGITSHTARSINFTGFAGTWGGRTALVTNTIYGNLLLSSGMTVATSTGTYIFGATSGTQTITSNGVFFDSNISIGTNGISGTQTVLLSDALNANSIVTHRNGDLDLNGKTLTVSRYATAAGTKNLIFNGGTLLNTGTTSTSFNNAVPSGFTTTAGTGTGYIRMTGAGTKTFVGGGSTFNCTLSNDASSTLTISGSNTFTSIANGTQPATFTFTAGTTQTLTNWNVSGTAGNLVTIKSSAAGTAASLSKASGTVSADYLSIQDSTATGGASWYAGANSTNVSGNSGWIFTAPPVVTAGGNFFFMF